MKLPSTSSLSSFFLSPRVGRARERLKVSSAFTLTEILVVVGIFALLMSFSLVVSLDIYRGDSFRGEQDVIISILQKARSQSINNINETSHGIRFEPDQYVLFDGDGGEVEFPMNTKVTYQDMASDTVTFKQLSGNTDSGIDFTFKITNGAKTSAIEVTSDGTINWDIIP